jgi:O-antigen/teichoic acid export membrane protein
MQIVRNAAASVGQNIVSALVMFVLYRAVLEMIGAEQLGIWSIVVASVSASRVGELGLAASVTRFVALYLSRGETTSAGFAIQTAVVSIGILLVLLAVAAYPLLWLLFDQVFSGSGLTGARALLPYALICLVLNAMAGVFQSGLDGCQRYDLRAVLIITGQVLFLLCALVLVPIYGLIGLAWAQIGQETVLLVGGWLLLRYSIPGLPWFPMRWRKCSFREMLGYGLQFQIAVIAAMCLDPVTKVLLGKYGGLDAAGYYHMASQLVAKARALTAAANRVVVPVAAGTNEHAPHRLTTLYQTNMRFVSVLVFPLYALVAAWVPLISELWIGRYEPQFTFFALILVVAWCSRSIADPAYFFSLGTGHIVWITVGCVWMGLSNFAIGMILGPEYGSTGVVLAVAASYVSGSFLIIVGFHRKQGILWRFSLPSEGAGVVGAGLLAAGIGVYTYNISAAHPKILCYSLSMTLPLLVLGPALWLHPLRTTIQEKILHSIARKASV